jgi:hypothetical protein
MPDTTYTPLPTHLAAQLIEQAAAREEARVLARPAQSALAGAYIDFNGVMRIGGMAVNFANVPAREIIAASDDNRLPHRLNNRRVTVARMPQDEATASELALIDEALEEWVQRTYARIDDCVAAMTTNRSTP